MADSQQLDIEVQINNALKARAGLLDNQKSMIIDQIALAQEMCRALECKELDGYNERLAETRKGLLDASDATDKTTKSTQNMTQNLKKSKKSMFSFKGAAVGAAVAIKNAFGLAFKVIKSIGSLASSLVSGAFNLVKGAMAAYSGMLDGMAQKAIEGGNAALGLRNAFEDVKDTLGDLATGAGRDAVASYETLRSQGNNLAGTGIRLAKVFGRGPDGFAAALAFVSENIQGLGPQLDRFSGQMAEAASEVVLMGKSLGFAGEDFANFGTMAGYSGESLQETLGRVSREIVTVSKGFGVNTKVMAKNLSTMMKMPGVFGSNTKEMLKTSVAAQKLGMSIEELTSVTGVFDDFESGAQAAADMAAEFGIVVDAASMMTAEPAEQMLMLKDAVAESGQSFEDMSRQERQRMADLTGMDMSTMQKMMDPSNAFDGDALDAVGTGVDAATAATLSQADATKELSKMMKQLHESMEPMRTSGGFLGAFTDGMARGIGRSKEFREMINGVRDAFKVVFESGKRVGTMLSTLLGPGGPLNFIFEHFVGLEETMRNLMPKIEAHFQTFVDDLMAGGDRAAGALPKLIEGIADSLFGSGGGGAFGAMMDGFHKLADLIVANIINSIPFFAKGLIKLFEGAVNLMTGGLPALGDTIAEDGIMPMSQRAFAGLMESGVINDLGNAFMALMNEMWTKFGPTITDWAGKALAAIITMALLQALPTIIVGGLIKGAMAGFGGAIGKAMGGATEGAPDGEGGTLNKSFGDKLASTAEGIKSAIDVLKDIGLTDILKAGGVLVAIGVGLALGVMGMVKLALWIQDSGVSMIALGITTMVMIGMAAAVYGATMAAEAAARVDPSIMGKAVVGLIAAGLVFGGIALIVTMVIKEFNSLEYNDNLPKIVEAAGSITMTILKATAAIIGMGAVLAVITVLGSNPVSGVLLAAAILGAMGIFKSISKLIKNIVSDFADFEKSAAEGAMIAAEAAGSIVETLMFVLDTIWVIMKNATFNKSEFNKVLGSIEDIVTSLKEKLMPTVIEMGALITGDPEILATKMNIIVSLVSAFSPITDLATAAMSIKKMNPNRVEGVIRSIAGGMTGIIDSMSGLVRDVVNSMTGLTPAQMRSAAAAGPMLDSVAGLLTSFKPDSTLFSNEMVDTFSREISNGNIIAADEMEMQKSGSRISTSGAAKSALYIKTFVDLISQIGPPLKDLVLLLSTIEIPGDHRVIKRNMETITSVMQAVASSGDALTSIQSAAGEEGQQLDTADVRNMKSNFTMLTSLFMDDTLGQSVLGAAGSIIGNLIEFGGTYSGSSISNINTALDMLTNSVPNSLRQVKIIGDQALQMVGTLPDDWNAVIVQPILDMITALNELDSELSTIGSIDVNSILRGVGEALKVENETITVERGSVNVEIKLNVVMRADELSKVLVDGEWVRKGDQFDSKIAPLR